MTIETPPPGPPVPPEPGAPGGPEVPPSDPYAATNPYYAQPPADKTNVLAIVSLILGVVSYFTGFFLGIGAVITGHIALSQIKRTGAKGRGMAIAGLILGYFSILAGIVAVIVLIFVFAAIGVANHNLNNALQNPPYSDTPYSSSPDDGSSDGSIQTTDQACTLLDSQVSDSATALSDNFAELQSDPAAAIAALQNLSGDFNTAQSQINNPDVLEAA